MERLKKKFKSYVKKVWKAFNKPEMRVLPGNVAFFFVLALIPIITITAFIASYFSISVDMLIGWINNFLPKEASQIVIDAISGKGFDTSVGTFNIIAFFVATNGTYAVINASNTLYNIKDSDQLRDRVKSIILLIILVLLIVFLILVPVFGGNILSLFKDTHFTNQLTIIYKIVRWPTTFFLIFITLKLIYTIAPNKKIESSSTTLGALFTTFCWVIATAIFSYYLEYFANYNIIYGNLSSMIILMMWIYIISYVLVLGMAINAVNLNDKK